MSRSQFDSRPRTAHDDAPFWAANARTPLLRPAKRLTCAALIALAAAGCSQEVQRFDNDTRETPTAQLHYNEQRYAEDGFASWRRSQRGDLRGRRAPFNDDPVTRSLPDEREPLREYERGRRAAPSYDREPRPPRRTTHTVQSGDTLYSIARSHDVSVDKLAQVNGLTDPSLIRVGDTLYIPDASYAPRAQRRDRRRAAGRAPNRSETRQARRARSDANRRAPRYSDDQLYIDPLLSDRHGRDERRGERRTAERPDRERRRNARDERQREPRRERISSTRPQRATRVTPPPAPEQRPQRRQPSRIARAQQATEPAPVPRVEPTTERTAASEQKTSAAECSALMKNPPARSGANFRRPAKGLIISRFGEKSNGQRNDGINISVPRGTPVKAAENGVVVYAGDELMGLGKLVLVRHADGWVSAYAHNDEILVGRCDTVERGQTISRAGVSGNVTKPQLHFELRKNARPVDPEQHLAGMS